MKHIPEKWPSSKPTVLQEFGGSLLQQSGTLEPPHRPCYEEGRLASPQVASRSSGLVVVAPIPGEPGSLP